MQIIRRNFALKVFALALAIVGWAYFRYLLASDPVIAARFDQQMAAAVQQISVPIEAINVPPGHVARFRDKEAVVTISPQRGAPEVKPDEIRAVLDLSKVTAPANGDVVVSVPVTHIAPAGVVLQSLNPATVTVTIERIEQRQFSLAVHYVGQPRSNLVIRGQPVLSPAVASVHGPSGALAQVTAVRVDVPMPSNPSQLDEMIRPLPVDSLGEEVAGLQVSPDLVRVEAAFTAGTGTGAK